MEGKVMVWIGTCICFCLMTMSLFLCAFLLFVPEVDNRRNGPCIVTECTVRSRTCSSTSCTGTTKDHHCTTSSYICYDSTIYYVLDFGNGTSYRGSSTVTYSFEFSANARCNNNQEGKDIKCYYDQRKIGSTLSLSETSPVVGGIVTVVLFTLASFGFLVACVISSVFLAQSYGLV